MGKGRGGGQRARGALLAAPGQVISWVAGDGWEVAPAEAMRWDLTADRRREERARRGVVERQSAAAVADFWSECVRQHPAEFNTAQPLAQIPARAFGRWLEAANQIRYDYHCVLNGSPATFGVEIEFVTTPTGGTPEQRLARVAQAFHTAGLAAEPGVRTGNAERGWTIKEDSSVPEGGELVSPILRDQPACWQQLRRALAILQEQGCRSDPTCGLHVHVGAFRLENRPDHFRRLWQVSAVFEDLLYRLAAPGGLRRHRGVDWTQPLTQKGYVPLHSVADFQAQAKHVDALNFEWVGSARNTVEFRYANSTLNHLEVQAFVGLYVGMLEAARNPTLTPDDLPPVTPLGTHALGMLVDLHHTQIRRLADLLYPRNSRAKLRLLWLYGRTAWQARGEAAPSVEARPLRYPGLAA